MLAMERPMGTSDLVRQHRINEAAKRYAEADRTDPFAYARAMAHIRNGIADVDSDGNPHYDATEVKEQQQLPPGITLSNGDTSFEVTRYRNIKRA
jgi:hypothetical protein